jgi:hypothetical protein
MTFQVLVPDEIPQHIAQTQDANQASLLPRRSAIRSFLGRYIFTFDNDESMTPSLADVGEDRGKTIARRAGHHASKVARSLGERYLDRLVEYLVSVLSDQVLSRESILVCLANQG